MIINQYLLIYHCFLYLYNASSTVTLNSSEIEKQIEPTEKAISDLPGLLESNVTITDNTTATSSVPQNETSIKPLHMTWNCSLLFLNEVASVIMVKNDTQISEIIAKANKTQGCFLLYFYVQWCEFCAQMSMDMNTIGRIFYGLPVLAVDANVLTRFV